MGIRVHLKIYILFNLGFIHQPVT